MRYRIKAMTRWANHQLGFAADVSVICSPISADMFKLLGVDEVRLR